MKTILLDRTAWDMVVDSYGNIALATDPYSIAQDVASAIRTFLAECWYDNRLGLPYFQQVLGHFPPTQLLQTLVETQALTVPEVVKAKCTITAFTNRKVSGIVEIIDSTGAANNVEFSQ